MDGKNVLMWIVLFAVLALCAGWHIRENTQLTRQLQRNSGNFSAKWLEHFAWMRSIQLLSAVACGIIVIIIYDWQLSNARHDLAALNKRNAELDQQLSQTVADATTAHASFNQQLAQQSAVIASRKTFSANQATVEEVYSPEKGSNDRQSVMDGIKKRYEDILVNYMFLKKCGKANASDYPIIMSALAQEMASVNAPGRLQADILTAAQGSYKEMYSKSSCDGQDVDALNTQYTDYIRTLTEYFPAQ